jgi:hypothetical protein
MYLQNNHPPHITIILHTLQSSSTHYNHPPHITLPSLCLSSSVTNLKMKYNTFFSWQAILCHEQRNCENHRYVANTF